MRSFYVATGLERAEEAKALALELRALGLAPSYEWWQHGSVQDQGPDKIREVAMAEVDGVQAADLFVALLPGGRGTHTELGVAIACSLARALNYSGSSGTILLVGPTEDASGRTCAFYLHPHVEERFANVGELLAWLRSWRRCNPLPQVRQV
jgi:hypothetical protein